MKRFNGAAISRHQLFTLSDGTFVIQWDDSRVQELLTGQYRDFDYRQDYGHAITNYELAQLRTSGRVEHYNRTYVWIYALPEAGRFGQRRVLDRGDRIRAYYLMTDFAKPQLEDVRAALIETGLQNQFCARSRDNSVVLLPSDGLPFRTLEEAETGLRSIYETASERFENLAIAFIETSVKASMPKSSMDSDNTKLNLDEIIASQSDTSKMIGKLVVLALNQDDERQAFGDLLSDMKLQIQHAYTASEALQLLEDHHPHLFIMDIKLPDMQGGWPFIGKIREIERLRDLPILVIADQINMGATVAKVDYLIRPVSIARLRHNVWVVLNQADSNNRSSNP